MRVLLTNDDGVGSPGLRALAIELIAAGHDVVAVAPFTDCSGTGATLQLAVDRPISTAVVTDDPPLTLTGIDGGPSLAVLLANAGAFGPRPDLVVCGVNAGANTGRGVLHSATVGAALTARTLGLSALALSLASDDPADWSAAAAVGRAAVDWLVAARRRTLLNVNVPDLPYDDLAGVRYARLAAYGTSRLVLDPDAGPGIVLRRRPQTLPIDPETDVGVLAAGFVSVTVLTGILGVPPNQLDTGFPELKLTAGAAERGA